MIRMVTIAALVAAAIPALARDIERPRHWTPEWLAEQVRAEGQRCDRVTYTSKPFALLGKVMMTINCATASGTARYDVTLENLKR